MRYYPAGLSRACPEDERGWHQGAAMACAPQGRQGMLLANQRTHEKVVAMRSRPWAPHPPSTRMPPAAARSGLAVSKAHHRHGP
jgi:hypothetical protein